MKKGTARLIIILALVIGIAVGISVPNPWENGVFEEETTPIEYCADTGLACTGEETNETPKEVEEAEVSILSNSGVLTAAIIEEIKAD